MAINTCHSKNYIVSLSSAAVLALVSLPSVAQATPPPVPCTVPVVSPVGAQGINGRVDILEDRRALEELKARYIIAVDATVTDPAKVEDILALMTDDVCLDYGPYGIFHGKQELKSLFQTVTPTVTAWSFHAASNSLLTINGSQATGQWRILAHGVFKAAYSAGVQNFFARYQDGFVKTQAGWKFRTLIVQFEAPPTGP